ncbi:MAG: hypothetical protein MJZ38_06955 [archaeon]|nr:hypothetical protein [archaeon]
MTEVQVVGLRGGFTFDEAVSHFIGLGGEVVLFNPSVVCGRNHVISAVMHADRAFAEGTNRARNILTEIALYVTFERQIGRALKKSKPAEGATEWVAAVLDVKGDLELERLGAVRDDSLCDATEEKARNLGVELFDGTSVEDAVLEQVAMVDLLRS